MPQLDRITFGREDLDLFRRLSHDSNPLHVDPAHASRTPFGECVVYGVLGVLTALAPVLRATPVRLRHLRATFMRPLFMDQTYDVVVEPHEAGQLTVELRRGGSKKLTVVVDFEPTVGGDASSPPDQGGRYVPRPLAVDGLEELEGRRVRGHWQMDTSALEPLRARIGFDHRRLPLAQLAALVWSSYLIGMELPGRQALFTSLTMSFAPGAPVRTGALDHEAAVVRVERRLGLVSIAARLSSDEHPLATADLEALVRPGPVVPDFALLRRLLPPSDALRGKACVITGASRGLGALLAVGSALAGADVVLTCRSNRQEAAQVRDEIAATGRGSVLVEGDVRDPGLWQAMATEARQAFGRVDLLVHNAFPAILPLQLSEITSEVMRDFVAANIGAAVTGLQVFLPELAATQGTVVLVSSAYAQSPPRELAHYVMVKSALEGLMRAVAVEHRAVRFLVVRPPKIRTDQTNSPLDLSSGLAAERVAARVIEALIAGRPASGNHQLVEAAALMT